MSKTRAVRDPGRSGAAAPLSVILDALLLASAVIFIIVGVLHFYTVRGTGMTPSISDHGIVITSGLPYTLREPARGDVVSAGGHVLRVIGLPGETIIISGGRVYIDSYLAEEPYLETPGSTYPYRDMDTFFLEQDEYFLLCDDRSCYDDSRSGRIYRREEITSKAVFTF